MTAFAKFLIARLREPSTYAGLGTLAGLVGYALTAEQINAIIAFLVSAGGLIAIFLPEQKPGA